MSDFLNRLKKLGSRISENTDRMSSGADGIFDPIRQRHEEMEKRRIEQMQNLQANRDILDAFKNPLPNNQAGLSDEAAMRQVLENRGITPKQEGFIPTAYKRPNYVEQDAPGAVLDQLTTPLGMRGSMPQPGDITPPLRDLSDVQQYVQKKREASRLKDLVSKMAPQKEPEQTEPQKDEAFSKALDRMQRGQNLGNIVDASAKIGAGIAGLGANSQVKADKSGGQMLKDAESQELQKLEVERENEIKQIERQLAKEENAKDSPYSKMVQGLAKQLSPALEVGDLSAKQIFKVLPALQGIASAKAAQEMRKLQMQSRMEDKNRYLDQRQKEEARRQNKEIYNVVKDFEKDNVVKQLKEQKLSFAQAQGLLEAMKNDNKVAVGGLGSKMARAMGEVGVLTDADVIRYIQRMDVAGRVQDYFSRNFQGRVSDFTQKDLEDIVNIMQLGAGKKMKEVQEKYINYAYENFAKPFGIPREELLKRFNVKPNTGKPEMSAKDKAAMQWAQQNQDDPRAAQIIERLKQKGF